MQMLYVLAGPTAVGKTAAAIQLAQAMNAEILSADSVQIYQGMDIGSAKPSLQERQGVPHHMMDIIPPGREQPFTVAEYQRSAFACIEDIQSRGKQVLVVGGTGLYIRSLCEVMDFSGARTDEAFRQHWEDAEAVQPGAAHAQLLRTDPQAAHTLHPNDKKRVIRALEINHMTGRTLAENRQKESRKQPRYASVRVALNRERQALYARIDQRVELMLAQGLKEEVQGLLDAGVPRQATSMQGIGYKEVVAWIDADITRQQAVERIQQASRRYAKRQWTWFRRDEHMRWFDVEAYPNVSALVAALLAHYQRGDQYV